MLNKLIVFFCNVGGVPENKNVGMGGPTLYGKSNEKLSIFSILPLIVCKKRSGIHGLDRKLYSAAQTN